MANDDYILRSDAISAIRAVPPGNWTWARYADSVACVPAADMEPRRESGVWIEQPDRPNVESDRMYRCSVCGYADEHSPTVEVPYCWQCGSRMRKMKKEADDAEVH